MAKCPDIYQDVQFYRDKYMKKNFSPSPRQPKKPAEIMRQPSKVFSKEFKRMMTQRMDEPVSE